MKTHIIHQPNFPLQATIPLAASKSESNRALIVAALSGGSLPENLASARDSQTLLRILQEDPEVWDVIDAGAPMRFLTAYAAATQKERLLTGTERMQQRPIGILVDALRQLGAHFEFEKKEGYPPMRHIPKAPLRGGAVRMRGDVSSQFISALMLVAPYLEKGLELQLEGTIGSRPYIDMTMRLMRMYGASVSWKNSQSIQVEVGTYQDTDYRIESDWSGASYWYSMLALAPAGELFLEGLRKDSSQGDSAIAQQMERFGVESQFEEHGVRITQTGRRDYSPATIDCSDFPDLAQTLVVAAAGLNMPLTFTGLDSLRIKETDRILALQNELTPFGVSFTENTPGHFSLSGMFSPSTIPVKTYEDHRMAMAFAPLVMIQPSLTIEDPDVVVKSYPEFWEHVGLLGG